MKVPVLDLRKRHCPACGAVIIDIPTDNPREFTWSCSRCGAAGTVSVRDDG